MLYIKKKINQVDIIYLRNNFRTHTFSGYFKYLYYVYVRYINSILMKEKAVRLILILILFYSGNKIMHFHRRFCLINFSK